MDLLSDAHQNKTNNKRRYYRHQNVKPESFDRINSEVKHWHITAPTALAATVSFIK